MSVIIKYVIHIPRRIQTNNIYNECSEAKRVLVNFVLFVFFEDMYNIREMTLIFCSFDTIVYVAWRDMLKPRHVFKTYTQMRSLHKQIRWYNLHTACGSTTIKQFVIACISFTFENHTSCIRASKSYGSYTNTNTVAFADLTCTLDVWASYM